MTVRELYKGAKELNLLDEDIDEVESLFRLPPEVFNRGVCGLCKHRKTDICPWPHTARCGAPICLTFEKKEIR